MDSPFTTELLNKLTTIIVKKLIKSGGIPADDYDDMVQSLRVRYLAKKEHIESLYKGTAQPQTYMSSVLRMMLLEELRAKSRNIKTEDIDAVCITEFDDSLSPEQKAIIENEKLHLNRVLLSMGKDCNKIKLCLKILYRIPVEESDFKKYLDGRPANGAQQYLEGTVDELNRDIYNRMSEITNLVEGSDNKPDAVRIWLSGKIDQIIKRLNFGSRSKYDADSLSILMEMAYT